MKNLKTIDALNYKNSGDNNKLYEYIAQIEKIISSNMKNRGTDKLKIKDQLLNTALGLNENETAVIVTGFYVKGANTGETDGPIGALSVANALENLGKKTIFVTDEYSGPFIKRGIEILNLKADIFITNKFNSRVICDNILNTCYSCHILAIERPGKAKDGRYYSMSGTDISEFVTELDYIFETAKTKGIKTSAIGDGGNEIGMGKVYDYVLTNIENGKKIASITTADNLIVAGVSNWGGHAVSAALSLLNSKNLMYDGKMEIRILDEIVKEGAVDGCIKKPGMSVDGISLEENLKVFTGLKALVDKFLIDPYSIL